MIFTKILNNIIQIKNFYPNKKYRFWYMIADIHSNRIDNPVVTELFTCGRKLNIFLVFIAQSYFAVTKKNIRLNSMH